MPKKNLSYKNRGMFLENIINETNNYYLEKDRAIIYKKPTPIKVLNVEYRTKKTTMINKAVFSHTSTLDYNGIYKGHYIEFDAKECGYGLISRAKSAAATRCTDFRMWNL